MYVSTQKYDLENRLCAQILQTQDFQIFNNFYMSQMNPKEFSIFSEKNV